MFKYFCVFLPILFFVVFIGSLIYVGNLADKRTVRYDCGMAEWHPDIPVQVKEECRKRLSGRI
jgi:hypothetical protein